MVIKEETNQKTKGRQGEERGRKKRQEERKIS
jgi:hypothetical protein